MPVFAAEHLRETGTAILEAAGTPGDQARMVAGLLVEANLAGHDSHGVIRLPQYVHTIERGEIRLDAQVEIVRQTAVAVVLDGQWGFGQVVLSRAVELGLERARATGLAAITLRRANHVGRLGSYVEHIARQKMIGLLLVNMHGGGAAMVPWGGKEARLGTNPLAAGLPREGGEPLVLDMTTSVVAEGKVRIKRNRGEKVPEGWIVDAQGRPSLDPAAFYGPPRGGLLPFGGPAGHKGYGLGLAVELLGGALSGAGCAGRSARNGNGALLLVIDIAGFAKMEEYYRQVEDFIAFVKASPRATGFEEILMPGEVEARTREKRLREGIFVEEETWRQIVECGGNERPSPAGG
jgi:uncharacterized oxidoreductase